MARLSDSLRLTNGFKDRACDLLPRVSLCFLAEDRSAAQRLADAAQIGSTITINGTVFPYRPIGTRWRGARLAQHGTWDAFTAFILWTLLGAAGVPGGFGGDEGGDTTPDPSDGVVAPKGTTAYHW